MNFNKIICPLFFLITVVNISCKKLVEIDPPRNQFVTSTVFSDDATATAAVTGIYTEMITSGEGFASGGQGSIGVLAGLSADEFLPYSATIEPFYFNDIPVQNAANEKLWALAFKYIYYANAALEGIANSSRLSTSVKSQLEGESKFIRAFNYFYLVNLFGELPLVLTTDYQLNKGMTRVSINAIYEQILKDLSEAKEQLVPDYSSFSNNRVRIVRSAASAMLARVYLFTQQWGKAEAEASDVIDNSTLYAIENDLNKIFLANSTEAIWQLMPVAPGINTWEGQAYILEGYPTTVSIRPELFEAFATTDLRKINWIDSIIVENVSYYYPYKYKIKYNETVTEYSMVLRLSEQYLIRAEARAMQDKLGEAITDLDTIRNRAGLLLIHNTDPGISKENLLLAITNEKRFEFFSEWGHRWLDLKRLDKADEVLGVAKGSDWQLTDKLYPIPFSEIQNNPNLLPQNAGYH